MAGRRPAFSRAGPPPAHARSLFQRQPVQPHFTETLVIGDEWLAGFISELSDDETPYLFSKIPVEILGSVYERFLGKVVVLKGRGISVEEKPEVRKAGGVYYTPRNIVDYIIEQTAGKLLDEISHPGSRRRESAQTSHASMLVLIPRSAVLPKSSSGLRCLATHHG